MCRAWQAPTVFFGGSEFHSSLETDVFDGLQHLLRLGHDVSVSLFYLCHFAAVAAAE